VSRALQETTKTSLSRAGGEGCGSRLSRSPTPLGRPHRGGVTHPALDRARHARVLRRPLACRDQFHEQQVYRNRPRYHRLQARYLRRRSSSHHVPRVFFHVNILTLVRMHRGKSGPWYPLCIELSSQVNLSVWLMPKFWLGLRRALA
jgi:hypothetical protein